MCGVCTCSSVDVVCCGRRGVVLGVGVRWVDETWTDVDVSIYIMCCGFYVNGSQMGIIEEDKRINQGIWTK